MQDELKEQNGKSFYPILASSFNKYRFVSSPTYLLECVNEELRIKYSTKFKKTD
jgi:hypothetical protein